MGFVPSVPVAFAMLIISMVAWGSWTNTQKKTGNWRFEAYYWDYILSIVISTFLLATLLGGFSATGWSPLQFLGSFANNTLEGSLWALGAGFIWSIFSSHVRFIPCRHTFPRQRSTVGFWTGCHMSIKRLQ